MTQLIRPEIWKQHAVLFVILGWKLQHKDFIVLDVTLWTDSFVINDNERKIITLIGKNIALFFITTKGLKWRHARERDPET